MKSGRAYRPLPAILAKGEAGAAVVLSLALVGVVAASRLGAVWAAGGWHEGEADSALFVVGVWRWSHWGPHASLLYDSPFSAGYYWLAGGLAQWRHLPLAGITFWLDLLSFAAALATAPLVFALARRFVSSAAAFWSSLLFLLTPGVWMLSLEPHPQGLGMFLALAAFYCCLRAAAGPARHRAAFLLIFVAVLAAALLVRSDAIFLYPAFLCAAFLPPGADARLRRPGRGEFDRLLELTVALAAATALFFLARAAILAQSARASEADSWRRIAGFMGQISPLHQLLPVITGLGPVVCLVAAAGLVLLWVLLWRRAPLAAWPLWIVAWAGPGTAFWLLIRGNNARHMAIYSLPLLWFACEGWARWRPAPRRRSWLAAAVLAALALDCIVVPASSDVTIYPSGNVVASYRDLAQRESDMRALATAMMASSAESRAPIVYFGSSTSPYLLAYALEARPAAVLAHAGYITTLTWPPRGRLVFHEVFSSDDFLRAMRGARAARSLEFDARGRRLWFLGEEWRWLPLHRRWYAGRAPLQAVVRGGK